MTPSLDGLLVVDKPVGPTSHDVVAKVRRACRGARVGHTGTLDPMASGVLVLVMGRATRLAQFLSASDKSYEATVRLGIETDTYDAEGESVERAGAPHGGAPGDASRDVVVPRAPEVEQALGQFRGAYEQLPPPFSAKKVAGARAYELARQQRPVTLAPVPVAVHALELIACEGDLVRITVTCSAGFYVRVLAHELGRALRCGAHLVALRRTRSGQFDLDAAIPLERATAGPDAVAAALVPLDAMLPEMRAARLTARGAERTRHGRGLEPDDVDGWLGEPPATGPTGPVRLLDPDGHLVAIGARRDNGEVLHPGIVLV